MSNRPIPAVTGAFGYTGKYIAQRLLDQGVEVRTLTNAAPTPDPFGGRVAAFPLDFNAPEALTDALRGVSVLYNTYWVRFNHKWFTFAQAVQNTLTLFRCAQQAGVERVVHVSITNPSEDSPLEYFRGKAQLERALKESGLSHAILRPAVIFGKEDILINNIAWALRRLPVFGVFGDGLYRLQPIHVDDMAALAVQHGASRDNAVVNAIGPEIFTYRGLVAAIGAIIGKKRPIVSVPPWFGYVAGLGLGCLVNDIFLTRAEIAGLMAGLLYVDAPAAGGIKLTDWANEHADALGRRYASELARRRK